MIGEYIRVTPEVMQRAIADPEWARDYIDELQDAEEDPDGPTAALVEEAKRRLFSTYKVWNILGYLLERAKCPVDVVFGEEEFADDDWGYGPPLLLPPDRVRLAAEVLRGYNYEGLAAGVTDADLHAADVYPIPEPSEANYQVLWAQHWFQPLVEFFAAAARDGDAVIVWIS